MKYPRPSLTTMIHVLAAEDLLKTNLILHGRDSDLVAECFEVYMGARDAYLDECAVPAEPEPSADWTPEKFLDAYKELCDASGFYVDDGQGGDFLDVQELDEDYPDTLEALRASL